MIIGVDLGGTKTAVIAANSQGEIFARVAFSTSSPKQTLAQVLAKVKSFVGKEKPEAIGISCGGPLDRKAGLILSPPNLPGWDRVEVNRILGEAFGCPVNLENDANACALAEWKYGAGIGLKDLIFLTFGTGMGAGLILNGRLYRGSSDLAGEVGHLRLAEDGPWGHGKAGSFEGFCSGGGLARLARQLGSRNTEITAKELATLAKAGDPQALEVFRISGEYLGRGLAILVDLLNPQAIIIGSIFQRAEELLREHMEGTLQQEAFAPSLKTCKIVPAKLGDKVGDYAAISVAMEAIK